MNTEATYHDDKDTVFDIKTDAQKQENAENLIKTGSQKDRQTEAFLKDNKDKSFFNKEKSFVKTEHSVHINNRKIKANTKDEISSQIDSQLSELSSIKSRNKKNKQSKNHQTINRVDKQNTHYLNKNKSVKAKSAIKNVGLFGAGILNESEEFRDTDKITDKVSTLKRAKDIADKIKKSRRASKARSTANKIKATEKAIKAQQVAQKASSIKASASGAKAVAGASSAVGSAASAPILGVIGVVLLALACIIAFATLLMTILSNKPNDAGALTGIEREIAIALMNNGYDKIHVAAIMGNMSAESGFNSKALQDVGDFDNLYGDDRTNEHGYGLNQMTNGRKNNLCGLAEGNGANHSDINSQVQYFCTPAERAESNWNKSLWRNYDCIPISRRQWELEKENLEILTVTLMAFWERPSFDPSINHVEFRKSEAQRIFSALNSGGGDGTVVGEAQAIANDNSHGYDYTYGSCRTLNPDVDCSSFVFYSLKNAGYSLGDYPFSTRDMGGILKGIGFQEFGYSGYSACFPGDVLWNSGHTEIYLGNGQSIGAHDDYDGQPGDSSGREVCPGSADQGWTLVYRPPAR